MYHLIIMPIMAAIISQAIKLSIDAYKKQFSWSDLNSYGGMPSSHAAMVSSLAGAIGYLIGWQTPEFAIALVFAIITIRDAAGFRFQLGIHAKIINRYVSELPVEKNYAYPHLRERLGHKPMELLAGIAVGLAVTALYIIFVA